MKEASNILETRGISYSFGTNRVCHDINLEVSQGSFCGFLGDNGSGKTTIIRILLQHLFPQSGEVLYDGKPFDAKRVLSFTGTLIETPAFFPSLTVRENLSVMGKFRNVLAKDIDEILSQVGLFDVQNKKVPTLSLGMKQRLAIARALLGNPKLLILDEPTNGLDPSWRKNIRDILQERHRNGTTIFMSSHLLQEIEQCCDHICVLREGTISYQGKMNAFVHVPLSYELNSKDLRNLEQILERLPCRILHIRQENIEIELLQPNDSIEDFHKALIEQGVILTHLRTVQNSLEDRFVGLSKKIS